MDSPNLSFSNQRIYDAVLKRREKFLNEPDLIYPWWSSPCKVKVLILSDGGIDYGDGDFGLSTFISVLLNDAPNYVKFELSLALRGPNGDISGGVAAHGHPQIVHTTRDFRFTDIDQIKPYDQIWFFGLVPAGPSGLNPDELKLVNQFMNQGGGVFATGDHGNLGAALCSKIPRVRSMRYWGSFYNASGEDEVSMDGRRRNDTNQTGRDAGSQFDDQSDDIPQPIQPKFYTRQVSPLWKETYPHPLLCSPLGVIDVMPDHPHEGECRVPADLTQPDLTGGDEYPTTSGGLRVSPELISFSSVNAGNTAGNQKLSTEAHSFGGICVYDGHRVNVGRVVTDATWHHFVNVNLIGELEDLGRFDLPSSPEHVIKDRTRGGMGFLSTAAGRAAFDKIKYYFLNIGIWLSPPSRHSCFYFRTIVNVLNQHRVIEAAMLNPLRPYELTSLSTMYSIGTHARDVIGKSAGQCRSLEFVIDKLRPILPQWAELIDPWGPSKIPKAIPELPFVNLEPLYNLIIGSGLLNVHAQFVTGGDNKLKGPIDGKMEAAIQKAFDEGVQKGLKKGMRALRNQTALWNKFGEEEDTPSLDEYVIEGTVTNPKGEPMAGLIVKAVDQDPTGAHQLGAIVHTDGNGYYRITYSSADFLGTENETGKANIIVSLYIDRPLNPGEKLKPIKQSDPHQQEQKVTRIDVKI